MLAKIPSRLLKWLIESSDSPICLIDPQMAYVVYLPVMVPRTGSTSAMLIWIEAWSRALMIRFDAELEKIINFIKSSKTLFKMLWQQNWLIKTFRAFSFRVIQRGLTIFLGCIYQCILLCRFAFWIYTSII